jgi:hypothetical protein
LECPAAGDNSQCKINARYERPYPGVGQFSVRQHEGGQLDLNECILGILGCHRYLLVHDRFQYVIGIIVFLAITGSLFRSYNIV